jgi:ABC-type arginine transport system ATPase subunit
MKTLRTRQQKIMFLHELQQGRTSVQAILKTVSGVIYIENGNVIAHQTSDGYTEIKPEIAVFDYKDPYTHQVIIEDFSNP